MEKYLEGISVPAIAAAVFFVVKLIRYAVGKNDKFEKFIPLIAAGLGVIFAVVCFFALPIVVPADNVVVAIVLGAASGFTAIGTDQMMKQFGKKECGESESGGEDKTKGEGKGEKKPEDLAEKTKKSEKSDKVETKSENEGGTKNAEKCFFC